MQSKRIAVTGGIGSGKSTFCKILKEEGYRVCSCDEISKELLADEEYLALVHKSFPECFSNGTFNKAALSQKVFSDKAALDKLNGISHPLIIRRLFAEMQGYSVAFAEVPLLFESGMEHYFDEVIVITRAREKRISSVMARSGLSEEEIVARMLNQFDYDNLSGKRCMIIENDGSEEELRGNVKAVLSRLGL